MMTINFFFKLIESSKIDFVTTGGYFFQASRLDGSGQGLNLCINRDKKLKRYFFDIIFSYYYAQG